MPREWETGIGFVLGVYSWQCICTEEKSATRIHTCRCRLIARASKVPKAHAHAEHRGLTEELFAYLYRSNISTAREFQLTCRGQLPA
eukprot:1157198-Pelagomonas_calceolata.AAC.3